MNDLSTKWNVEMCNGRQISTDYMEVSYNCEIKVSYSNNYELAKHVRLTGAWGVGLATKRCDLNKIPLGNNAESWVLRSDGSVAHNGIVRHRIREIPEEGDMIVSLYVTVIFIENRKPSSLVVKIYSFFIVLFLLLFHLCT